MLGKWHWKISQKFHFDRNFELWASNPLLQFPNKILKNFIVSPSGPGALSPSQSFMHCKTSDSVNGLCIQSFSSWEIVGHKIKIVSPLLRFSVKLFVEINHGVPDLYMVFYNLSSFYQLTNSSSCVLLPFSERTLCYYLLVSTIIPLNFVALSILHFLPTLRTSLLCWLLSSLIFGQFPGFWYQINFCQFLQQAIFFTSKLPKVWFVPLLEFLL